MLVMPLAIALAGNVLLYVAMDTERIALPDGRIGRMGGLLRTNLITLLLMIVAVDALVVATLFIMPAFSQFDVGFLGFFYGGTVFVGETAFWGLTYGFSRVAAKRMGIHR